jgi:parallel beta-helix repeat protein
MKRTIALALTTGLLLLASWLSAQGPLTPPGAPAPTMKTLDQVEPRTPISSLPFTIASAGSYYLTGNLTGGAGGGILIGATGVTLDLMGFEVVGGTGDGISVSAGRSNIVIRNGTVRNWSGDGVDAFGAGQGRLERLRAVANQGTGLRIGPNSTVADCTAQANTLNGIETSAGCALRDCTVSGNLGTSGISVSSGAVLSNCSAYNNQTTYGIFATDGATLTNCTAHSNNGSATTSYGIHAGSGSTVIGCAAHSNTNDNATPTESAIGINALFGTLIKGCAVRNNEGHGIMVQSDCRVLQNSCDDNGKSGIRAVTSDNRIEGNNVTDNDIGVEVVSLGNFIIGNSASGSLTSNYEIAASNKVGVIVDAPDSVAISGSTGGAGVGTTNPWANFSF